MTNSTPIFEATLPTGEAPALSVTEVSQSLKRHVEEGFRSVRMRGEISGYKKHTSGHSYFALKDADAVMDAVAWRGTPLFVQPEDGLEVIVQGRITTYPGRSKYQIVIERLEAAGKGALMGILLERKERLMREGLFERSRPLPAFPKKIGIITSPTGAVIRDILHRLADRFPCEVLLWSAQVQGPGSIEQVTNAIAGFNKMDEAVRPDVLIVARGGGSLEDLWTFNEEAVVRAVANSGIPIISAIGHETDTTLCDFAADVRAPTPTAAAELATPVAAHLISTLQYIQENMASILVKNLRFQWMQVKGLSRGLPQPHFLLETAMQKLDDTSERLSRSLQAHLSTIENRLTHLKPRHPAETVNRLGECLHNYVVRFTRAADVFYQHKSHAFSYLAGRLSQASYTKILEKGFSWVDINGLLVPTAAAFPDAPGSVTLHFMDGTVTIEPKSLSKRPLKP